MAEIESNEQGRLAPPEYRAPTENSLEVARLIADRVGRRIAAPVRYTFIGAHDDGREPGVVPPLARILRGGRGGEVRLKLALTFIWFAVRPPHDLTFPTRVWAELLGLSEPATNGTRRVRQGIAALTEAKLIEVEQRPGQPSTLYLLDEGGRGEAYTPPGTAFNRARGSLEQSRHRYIQIPDVLWTNGWIELLSGPALAMLLVLYAERGAKGPDVDLWFSPKRAKELYGLSEGTRVKGLRELRAANLITARKRSSSRDALDFQRLRNTYRIDDAALHREARVPVFIDPDPPLPPGFLLQDILATPRMVGFHRLGADGVERIRREWSIDQGPRESDHSE